MDMHLAQFRAAMEHGKHFSGIEELLLVEGAFDRNLLRGRCHVVESLMRVRRVSQVKSCGGDDFAPRLHGA